MARGILILALGDRRYGRYAYNLALSMKTNTPDVNIAVGYSENGLDDLSPQRRAYFDHVFEVDPQYYHYPNGQRDYFKAKFHLPDISPFDQTIFIDADTVWAKGKSVIDLFDKLNGVDVSLTCNYFVDLSRPWDTIKDFGHWIKLWRCAEYYGKIDHGLFCELSSYFLYFQKCASTTAYFAKVLELAMDFDCPVKEINWRGDLRPDEYFFNVAGYLMQKHPHVLPYAPVFMMFQPRWDGVNGATHYYALTFPNQFKQSQDEYKQRAKSYWKINKHYVGPEVEHFFHLSK